jgi:hypothetical protein
MTPRTRSLAPHFADRQTLATTVAICQLAEMLFGAGRFSTKGAQKEYTIPSI